MFSYLFPFASFLWFSISTFFLFPSAFESRHLFSDILLRFCLVGFTIVSIMNLWNFWVCQKHYCRQILSSCIYLPGWVILHGYYYPTRSVSNPGLDPFYLPGSAAAYFLFLCLPWKSPSWICFLDMFPQGTCHACIFPNNWVTSKITFYAYLPRPPPSNLATIAWLPGVTITVFKGCFPN